MMKILGIGNALVDVLALLEDDSQLKEFGLQRGGMMLIDDARQTEIGNYLSRYRTKMSTGGSAGNAVLALANLGAGPGFIGRVGKDEMGRFFSDNCREHGIDARLIEADGMTGVANTFISTDGERTFATHLGQAACMSAQDVSKDMLQDYGLLHIEGYLVQNHDLIETVARIAKELGMKISIDLASYNVVKSDLAFFRHLVSEYVDIVFANEEESEAFTQGKAPEDALCEIAGMCEVAVVKIGKRGSMAKCGSESCRVPGQTANVVDTTAAGDFFAGGFLYGYAHGWSLQECLETGTLLAGNVIQVIGTRLSDEAWEDIRAKVRK